MAIAFVLCLAGLALPRIAAAAPHAVGSFTYSHSFASEGQLAESQFGFGENTAVESATGNILVAGDGGVQVFSPSASAGDPPIAEFGGVYSPTGITQDPVSGAIYVVNYPGSVTKWKSDGAPTPTYTEDTSFHIEGLTSEGKVGVDRQTGDLLTLNPSAKTVVRYSAAGTKLASFNVGTARFLAVAENGSFYILADSTESHSELSYFNAGGTRLWHLGVEGSAHGLAINPSTDNVDLVLETSFLSGEFSLSEYDAAEQLEFIVPLHFPGASPGAAKGFAIGESDGNLYLPSFSGNREVAVFEPAIYPGVEGLKVLSVGTRSVRLTAEVDPGEGPPPGSYARFESSADGGQTWTPGPDLTVEAGGKIEGEIPALIPNSTFLVRAVAGNEALTHAGAPQSITTQGVAPVVTTGSATEVTSTAASVSGTIETIGAQTGYFFEYGLSAAYGSRVPVDREAVAGSGRAPRSFMQELTGLQPGSTYHFRIVATNSFGRSVGEDGTFTTTGESEASRVYEQVTPVAKGGGLVDPARGFVVSPFGSDLGYVMYNGEENRSAPLETRYVAMRGADGWNSGIPTDVPMNVPRVTVAATTLGISSDFDHAFVVSNKKLTPDALENATNLYVETLSSGAVKLVASSDAPGAFANFTAVQSLNEFVTGSGDFSRVVFESVVPMSGITGVNGSALYSWTEGGGLKLVSTLPDGSIPSAGLDYHDPHEQARWTSTDLGRIYFALANGAGEGVYLNEAGAVRAISTSQAPGQPSTPQPGRVLGVGSDGQYAFFAVSSEVPLTDDAPEVSNNVYRYDALTGRIEYLGDQIFSLEEGRVLGVSDDGGTIYFRTGAGIDVWNNGNLSSVPDPGSTLPYNETSFTSPDGRYFEFENYEESEFVGSEIIVHPPHTIYLYDRETGLTACISCTATGENPRGATLPDPEIVINGVRPSAVGDDGEAFFTTTAQLVPRDVNGVKDVYSYRDGVIRLISPGNGPYPAIFADRSADGKDVYFTTAQGLVPQDKDLAVDIYDARDGGGFGSPSVEPTPCAGEACSGPAASAPGAPSLATEAASPQVKRKPPAKHKKKNRKPSACRKTKARSKAGGGRQKHCGHHKANKANDKGNGGKR